MQVFYVKTNDFFTRVDKIFYVYAKLSSFHVNTCKILNHQSKINVKMKNNKISSTSDFKKR